ncbi:methylenetetrahydrofolate reductase [Candidatus Desulforudis audaxviator]|uniref:Methylenetetrahydrofolate reductase n=1 Tax=Desulforudis audaxviator (strain MP104C) TaxID=477974 RepID=B1I327_DESAP|nr:methylenetetrahydrofolate reductase [Candidatus Desulforudis audaxviator]ACA59393.1 methylenetetrahydrofolate reductase [Candidatus Desulforudis audaxviator MP104C]AZK59373.1 5,10-methylenetetrahydrofolate reductase [Candidatus Desulforudis audaxviator]
MRGVSGLARLLGAGHFVVTCEVGPPKGVNVDGLTEKAALLKSFVDAANVTDCQTAVVRLSSIAACVHLAAMGLEPVVQMTARDRNRIAVQSDLLGAYSLGIRNVLCLTGDHQKFGNHPGAKGVFDLDSVQMVEMVRRLGAPGEFQCGEPVCGEPPVFFVGAVENPCAEPLELRVRRLEKKIRAGARFVQTQCVYDLDRFRHFMGLVRARGLHEHAHILAGVTPLKSVRMARFMRDAVAGVYVPDEVVARIEAAADPAAEGVAMCVEQIAALREIEGVAGVHIMAVAWEAIVPEIVRRAGLYPRPADDEPKDRNR